MRGHIGEVELVPGEKSVHFAKAVPSALVADVW